jgi:hypothetical protein
MNMKINQGKKNLIKKFSIKKIPFPGNASNSNFKFLDIKIFLENNIGLFKKDEKNLIENPHYKFFKQKNYIKEFTEGKSELEFKKNCIHSKLGHCIILLLNGEINIKKKIPNLKFRKNLSLMNKLFLKEPYKNYHEIRFINATCHNELANSFKISKNKLPAIVYLDTQNYLYEVFPSSGSVSDNGNLSTSNDNEFTEEKINEFFDKINSRRFISNKINAIDIKFGYKNCDKKKDIMDIIDYEKLDRINSGLEDEDFEEEINLPEKDEI